MATQVLSTVFLLKRGTAEAWDRHNPVLMQGEPGWAIDAEILKIGDGKTRWKDLSPVGDSGASQIVAQLEAAVETIQEVRIPQLEELLEQEKQRAEEAEEKLAESLAQANDEIAGLVSQVKAIVDEKTGILQQAKKYTDEAIAALMLESGYGIDGDTLQVKDNKLYVAKVSTDVLEQGEMGLILFAGSASI